jgi:hypothetical protein
MSKNAARASPQDPPHHATTGAGAVAGMCLEMPSGWKSMSGKYGFSIVDRLYSRVFGGRIL